MAGIVVSVRTLRLRPRSTSGSACNQSAGRTLTNSIVNRRHHHRTTTTAIKVLKHNHVLYANRVLFRPQNAQAPV